MTKFRTPTEEESREVTAALSYDRDTGEFVWIKTTSSSRRIGDHAGSLTRKGYRRIEMHGREYLAHRVAWFLTHFEWPQKDIDHINGVRDDNRLCNLRLATHQQNSWNTGKSAGKSSLYKGVTWNKSVNKWQAQAKVGGKHTYIGLFSDEHEAHLAYCEIISQYHGNFMRAT